MRRHISIAAALALTAALAPAWADGAGAKDLRIAELEQRVEQLEKRVASLEKALAAQARASPADTARAALRSKAQARLRQDAQKYSREQLSDAERLYQVANKQFGSDAARASLNEMIQKYPDMNRTGCAVLYMGQMSQGEEQEKYLRRAIEEFSDCFYGDGVQVGAYARYRLAEVLEQQGKKVEAEALRMQIRQEYPDAVDHRGARLADLMPQEPAS
jgi:TolA-binding protein